jgi:ribosome biogenesis ATPase
MQSAAQPIIADGPPPSDSGQAAVACAGTQPLSVHQLSGLAIRAADFDAAVKKVQPSVRREGFATTPDVTWNDVGSLADVRGSMGFQCLSSFSD